MTASISFFSLFPQARARQKLKSSLVNIYHIIYLSQGTPEETSFVSISNEAFVNYAAQKFATI